MKRSFLKGITFKVGDNEINLPDEVIEQIMKENGVDILAVKSKSDKSQEIEKLQSELESKVKMLDEANSQIEKFKGMDIEGIKKEAEEWKTKYTEFENQSKADREAYEKKLADQQYDFKLNEYVNGQKFTSDFAKKAYLAELKAQGFKVGEDGTLQGANDYTKQFKEKNPGVFSAEEAPKPNNEPSVQFAASTSGGQVPQKGMRLDEMMKAANAGQRIDISQVGALANKQ